MNNYFYFLSNLQGFSGIIFGIIFWNLFFFTFFTTSMNLFGQRVVDVCEPVMGG